MCSEGVCLPFRHYALTQSYGLHARAAWFLCQVKKMQKAADKGRAAVAVGSYEDGIGHFRTALAVDPAHGVSAQSTCSCEGCGMVGRVSAS